MNDYVAVFKDDESIQLSFFPEDERIMEIGEKINEINEDAYMNGYNWEAFFNYYLANEAPDVLEEMDTDPEASLYAAYYPMTPENELKAEKLADIIHTLMEDEEALYNYIREEGGKIEWD